MPEVEKKRGIAAMSPEARREVARKGGLSVSKDRTYMAMIGKKGGFAVSRNKEHMSKIGKIGAMVKKERKADT